MFCFSARLLAQASNDQVVDFAKADSIAALYPNHSIANLKSLADKLTQPLATDIEKFRAIYRWVCGNIENDYEFYVRNKSRRELLQDQPEKLRQWNQKSNPYFFRKLLNEHKTICTGYAYLIKELSYHAGLTCKIIDGYGRTAEANIGGTGFANHSWNAIQLNQRWYLCDATWSSGVVDPELRMFSKQFDEAYFLTPPALFVRNHYPLDSVWMLLEDKPTLPDFLNGPLIYKGAIRYGIVPVYPATFYTEITKGEKLTFVFRQTNGHNPDMVELHIGQNTGSAFTKTHLPVYTSVRGAYALDYVFTRRGTYVVHLRFRDEYMFTYTVRVV